ncbi:MAG: hypothetical protein Q8L10_03550 [Candidatus Moranbacteria bacterium]|nr:hypothetical protein [Candidatus Moranbacteria bacterium]
MYKEPSANEAIKKPEAQENHGAPRSVEDAEELRQQMTSEAEKQTDHFKQECADDLSQVETMAEKDGLIVDGKDKKIFENLGVEAEEAKKELETEISPTKSQSEKASIVGITRDRNFKGSVIVKTENEEGRITGYALRKNSNGDWEGNEIRYMKDGSIGPVYQLHEADFSKLGEQGIFDSYESMSVMKERAIENPEILSEKEASKKFLAEERKKLAQEIREQRKAQRERLLALKSTTENSIISTENMESEQEDNQFGRILESQSEEANVLKERISTAKLSDQDAQDERENISQLVDNSSKIKSLKEKLEEHYAKADAIARERFDTLNRSLEHVMKRNNAFIVHKISDDDVFRHNVYSNVSEKATIEDDLDALLALEPSISASSVTPGKKASLWPGSCGLLLGGGQIGEASHGDANTYALGIKNRKSLGGIDATIEDINKIVGRQTEEHAKEYKSTGSFGKNEVVVNNPEVFGFFKNVARDDSGRFWADSLSTKIQLERLERAKKVSNNDQEWQRDIRIGEETHMEIVNKYRTGFDVATTRGMPLYVMTEEREIYEYIGVNNDGTVEIGKQLTPEEVATGRAGLPPEKRKQIGERLLEKRIFRKQETQEEAREIIDSL